MIYLQLFFSFLQIGMFSFGGGYAAMPLIREQVVSCHGWLDMGEFTNLITISQMTPGPIAINSATFVGTKIAGIPGAVVSTLGCILPSCILVTLLAWLYLKYQKMDLLPEVSATGCRGNDRVCGRIDSGICLLERGGHHRTGGHPLGDGGNLCDLPDPSSKNKMEPGTCDGVGWGNEVVGGDCGDWIKAGGESGESGV